MKTSITSLICMISFFCLGLSLEARPKPKGQKFKPVKSQYEGVIREFDARDEIQIYLRENSTDFVEIQFGDGMICEGPDGRVVNHDRLEDAVDHGLIYMVRVYCRRIGDTYVVSKAIVWPAN